MIKIYDAVIDSEQDGIFIMSLVDEPATEVNWVCFNKDKQQFAIVNPEEHILAGVVMVADTPIYRINELGEEYYLKFSKETIKQMAEKMLADGTHNNIDIQHNNKILEKGKVSLVELFIKDSSKGIDPNYLDVPDGSLLANYKINDEILWKAAKEGKLNGFSLSGFFTTELNNFNNNKMSIKEKLKKILAQFGKVETDKAVLMYEGDELVEGIEVMQENGEPLEDGEYITKDGKVIEVKDSVVVSMKDPEVVVEAEEVVEQPAAAEPIDYQPQIDELKKNMLDLEEKLNDEILDLKEKLNEILNKPVADPVEEEFSKASAKKITNKAVEYAKYLK